MKERWILENKQADFRGLGVQLGISPLVVKCMVNRGLKTKEEMKHFLKDDLHDLYDPFLMKNMKEAVECILRGKKEGLKAAIATDFDCDGIFSGYVLWQGLGRLGLDSRIYTPDREKEGYGLNRRIVDEAWEEGRRLLITCDNGIAACEAVAYARERGMTVIVTDHHEVQEELPAAHVILDPKQEGETYPFHGLCGCGVVFKLVCALYQAAGIEGKEALSLLEYTAIATVADVMELIDENRILVKYGLKALKHTKNPGLQALLKVQDLQDKTINAGHIGFVIGPCFNATGRISTVEKSFDLLKEADPAACLEKAEELKEINEQRKHMTEEGAIMAYEMVEKQTHIPDVILLLLTGVHESLAGIIAGRIKEKYHHPTIVFTEPEPGVIKGSGRSIESYNMFLELMKCKDLMMRFGGHKMAAGMTLNKENLDELRRRLNEESTLSAKDFCPEVRIDAAMPIGYVTERLMEELEQMEPFGTGNPKPVFTEQHFKVLSGRVIGKEENMLKLRVKNMRGSVCDALLFRGKEEFEELVRNEFGQGELDRMYQGRENDLDVAFTYYPGINEYQGRKSVQMQVTGFCRIGGRK